MNILEKHLKEIRDHKNIKQRIAYDIGYWVMENDLQRYAKIYYFDVKKHLFKNKITVTIYSNRPGILIGFRGETINKLKTVISDGLNKEVSINIRDFEPILFPYIP